MNDRHPSKAEIEALVALYGAGRLSDLVDKAQLLLARFPASVEIWNILGIANFGLRRLPDAEVGFRRAVAADPGYHDAHNNLGNALKAQGKLDEAVASYRRALEIKPSAEVLNNLGAALNDLGRIDEAAESLQHALALKPDYASALNNLGNSLHAMGRSEEAATTYRRALQLVPGNAEVHFNLGNALKAQGDLDAAVSSYNRSLAIRPRYAEAHVNLGNTLSDQGRLEEAVGSFRRALEIKPDYVNALSNLANALQALGRLDEAVATYREALRLAPDHAMSRSRMLQLQAHMCDWSADGEFEAIAEDLGTKAGKVTPFSLLALEDNPQRQQQRSVLWARETYRQRPMALPPRPVGRPEKLRIGYFSADFHNFPGMYLMAGMFERHDRDQFEIFAFSYGPDKDDEMRRRIVQGVDRFVDVRTNSDTEIVDLTRKAGIHLAINRNGYTLGNRSELFASRLAPVQLNFLGYPGTMGADFMDYIVADRVVVPDSSRAFYSEKIIYLPHSYQPNDDRRVISDRATTRGDFGLPDDAFVFCCFNNIYKVGRPEFDIWMRLLGQVGGSVLWLLGANKWAEENLRRQAQARGIDPDRLIFVDRLPQSEHLARHRHADLFVDTFNYNAHTTASDALWAGLPVVTKAGRQFAARVGASLLEAIELPELITDTEAAYEALILELATNPAKLAAIKQKLAANRQTTALFDTAQYTRGLEAGLWAAYERYLQGLNPADITVERQSS